MIWTARPCSSCFTARQTSTLSMCSGWIARPARQLIRAITKLYQSILMQALEAARKDLSRGSAKNGEVLKRPAASEDMPIFVVPPNRSLAAKQTAHQASDEPSEQEPSRQLLCLMAQECRNYYNELKPYSRPDSFICRLCPCHCQPYPRMDRPKKASRGCT